MLKKITDSDKGSVGGQWERKEGDNGRVQNIEENTVIVICTPLTAEQRPCKTDNEDVGAEYDAKKKSLIWN